MFKVGDKVILNGGVLPKLKGCIIDPSEHSWFFLFIDDDLNVRAEYKGDNGHGFFREHDHSHWINGGFEATVLAVDVTYSNIIEKYQKII
nr:MAG TPA: KOW2-KOW3 domains of Spt5, Spt5, RNA processing, Transcription [Caudoviricetes sp.]